MAVSVELVFENADATVFQADVLAMKYAQKFYGLDDVVAQLLQAAGVPTDSMQPAIGNYSYLDSRGRIAARHALFVGVPSPHRFAYQDIRKFASDVIRILAREAPATEHLAMTIHGAGFGLDEVEACLAQVEGYIDAIQTGYIAPALQRVSIVDRDASRVKRLRGAVAKRFEKSAIATPLASGKGFALTVGPIHHAQDSTNTVRSNSVESEAGASIKPHVFVAMSYSKHLDDVFHYGIQDPVRAAGYLCERMDRVSFTGEIVNSIKHKIVTASVIIAELSGANPNVYLEVGYAWGKERPTILVAPKSEELAFDVRGHRCLLYDGIQDLEDQLTRELAALRGANLI